MRHLMIGVDPGLKGGIAILEGNKPVPLLLAAMPLIKPAVKGGKKKGRDQYDVEGIVSILRRARATGLCTGVVEKLHPLPAMIARKKGAKGSPLVAAGGSIANYNRGGSFWGFVFLFAALGIPLEPVLPRTWQKEMFKGTSSGDTKQRSIIAAQRLFPGVSLLPTVKSRKKSDGLSDALLLAGYGRLYVKKVWSD